MTLNINSTCEQIIRNINNYFGELQKQSTPDEQTINENIRSIFNIAYSNVKNEEDFKNLTKSLWLKLHPDKAKATFSDSFFKYIQSVPNVQNIDGIPFRLLMENRDKYALTRKFNNFGEVGLNNVRTSFNWAEYNKAQADFDKSWADMKAKWAEEAGYNDKIFQRIKPALSSWINLNKISSRYKQPGRFIADAIKFVTDGALFTFSTFFSIFLGMILLPTTIFCLLENLAIKNIFTEKPPQHAWNKTMNHITHDDISSFGFLSYMARSYFLLVSASLIEFNYFTDLRWVAKQLFHRLSTPSSFTQKALIILTASVLAPVVFLMEAIKYVFLAICILVGVPFFATSMLVRAVVALPGLISILLNKKNAEQPTAKGSHTANPVTPDSDNDREPECHHSPTNTRGRITSTANPQFSSQHRVPTFR